MYLAGEDRRHRPVRLRRIHPERHERHRDAELRAEPVRRAGRQPRTPNDPELLITHARTQGDLLIEFNFQKSSGNWIVVLTFREWIGNASAGTWSDPTPLLNLGDASVNEGDILDCLNGDNPFVDGQFGEFAINLTELLGGDCRAFGRFLAKSRSSNQTRRTSMT